MTPILMLRPALAVLVPTALALSGCGASESESPDASAEDVDASASTDANGGGDADAAVADAAVADAADVAPDANLTVHAFVEVDGDLIEFEDTYAYDGSAGDRTISANIGPDCPITDCTTLYVSFPQDATPGSQSCEDVGISVQFNEADGSRYFSFGSDSAYCFFDLDVNDGETVAVSNLRGHLEADSNPADSRDLSGGEMRGPYQ